MQGEGAACVLSQHAASSVLQTLSSGQEQLWQRQGCGVRGAGCGVRGAGCGVRSLESGVWWHVRSKSKRVCMYACMCGTSEENKVHTQRSATQRNATQRNATQRNATQRNATQRNAKHVSEAEQKWKFLQTTHLILSCALNPASSA